MMKISLYGFFVMLMLSAKPVERCGQCGMDLSGFRRTVYEIRWTDGTATKTCGVQCGLTQQVLHRDRFKSSVAKDFFTGKPFNAQIGHYVSGSRMVADMAPGFIAFLQRSDAEKFRKESGGQVLSFEDALSAWASQRTRH
jgi:hypothetical protein